MSTTLAPARTRFALADQRQLSGRRTTDRPFGLTLAEVVINQPTLNLTGLTYDPVTQVVLGDMGPRAAKTDRTTGSVTTTDKTTYDHTTSTDTKKDTYTD